MEKTKPTPLGVVHVYLSVPFVLLGIAVLLAWNGSAAPEAVPATWRYYDRYVMLYDLAPLLGVGSLTIGVLNTAFLAWVLYDDLGRAG